MVRFTICVASVASRNAIIINVGASGTIVIVASIANTVEPSAAVIGGIFPRYVSRLAARKAIGLVFGLPVGH